MTEIYGLSIKIKQGSTWQTPDISIKSGGNWTSVKKAYTKSGGNWTEVYEGTRTITQYQTDGTFTLALGTGRYVNVKALGGGGGGGAGGPYGGSSPNSGAGYSGSSSIVQLKDSGGTVKQTLTVAGGAGGPSYDYGGYNGSDYEWDPRNYNTHDWGGLGESVSEGGIFVGTGGASGLQCYSCAGGSASGNGAGGGGCGDTYNNNTGYPAHAGLYGTADWVAAAGDYLSITVGARGNRGYAGEGGILGYPKYGGHGASGAVQIELI